MSAPEYRKFWEARRREQEQCPHPPDKQAHSHLHKQASPDSPLLIPPIEIRRCYACGKAYRVDGLPYDEDAVTAAWNAKSDPKREQLRRMESGLFAESEAA